MVGAPPFNCEEAAEQSGGIAAASMANGQNATPRQDAFHEFSRQGERRNSVIAGQNMHVAMRKQRDVAGRELRRSMAFDRDDTYPLRDKVVRNHSIRFNPESAGNITGRRGNDRPRRLQVGVDKHRPRNAQCS